MELYRHRDAVGGFSDHLYWSSSEGSASDAWYQSFVDGYQGGSGAIVFSVVGVSGYSKCFNFRVRAVRAF